MSKVKELREKLGIKQESAASHIHISNANYSKKENGIIKFSLSEAKAMAELLNTTIEYLFFDDEVSKNDTR